MLRFYLFELGKRKSPEIQSKFKNIIMRIIAELGKIILRNNYI